jgi:hypothetical protein
MTTHERPTNWDRIEDEVPLPHSIAEVVYERLATAEARAVERREAEVANLRTLGDGLLLRGLDKEAEHAYGLADREADRDVVVLVACPLCELDQRGDELLAHVGGYECSRNLVDQAIVRAFEPRGK